VIGPPVESAYDRLSEVNVPREEIREDLPEVTTLGLTCKEFVCLVSDYLDGGLRPVLRARANLHLRLCPGCRVYLRQMQQTIQTLSRLPSAPAAPAVRDELLYQFRKWKAHAC